MPVRLATSEPGWRRYCPDVEAVPAELRVMLDQERPSLITSRFSTPSGANARATAINSLFRGARELKSRTTIDVVGHLPPRVELDLRLKTAPVVRSKRLGDGRDIQHRFVRMDLRPVVPVVLFIATGSGKLAAEGFTQPFVQRLAEVIWEDDVALLCTKRWDRASRNEDLAGPILMAMEKRDSWLCTDDLLRPMDNMTRLMLFMDGWSSRMTTDDSDSSQRQGQSDLTGQRLAEGQVAYHLPSPPVPGMGVATLKKRPNLPAEKLAYLDNPGCRPDPVRVADGLSEVVGDGGEVADQVANVRFFLEHYGKPAWMDDDRLIKELSRRRYSTVHVRSLYGADAYMTAARGHTAWKSILDNLEVYETGVLRRSIGPDQPEVTITDVMPTDGPWASPADFARIREFREAGKQKNGARVRLSLAGIRATYDGVACRTRSVASPSTAHENEPCLAFTRLLASGHETRVAKHVLLPYAAFAESLVDAIITAAPEALRPLLELIAEADDAEVTGERATLALLDEQLAAQRQAMEGAAAQLGEKDENGQRILRGGLLTAAQDQYEQMEYQLAELQRQRADLVARTDAALPRADGLDPALLPRMVASLRDPRDHTYAKVWQRILSPAAFTTEPSPHPGKSSRLLRWRGGIKIDGGSNGMLVIPFEGSYDYHRVVAVHSRPHVERQHEYLAAMLAGTPYDAADLPARQVNRPRVARLLGIDDDHPLFECEDPRIVAAATAMLRHEQDGSVPLADGDPDFLAAVRRVHLDDRTARSWRRPYGGIVVAFYELAAETGTVLADEVVQHCGTTRGAVHTAFSTLRRQDPNWSSRRKQGYVLAPCERCGSHDRHPAEIAEISGLLCRNCGHDEAGVHWPLDGYGQYLA